jgi:hypothetical protein
MISARAAKAGVALTVATIASSSLVISVSGAGFLHRCRHGMFVLALQASLQINDGTTWSSADLQARMQAGTSLTASQTSVGREHDYNLSQGYAIAAPPTGQGDTVTIRISGISPGDVSSAGAFH